MYLLSPDGSVSEGNSPYLLSSFAKGEQMVIALFPLDISIWIGREAAMDGGLGGCERTAAL